jgi:ribose-phosphate pyrophosphokinase
MIKAVMNLVLLAGTGNPKLADATAAHLQTSAEHPDLARFPDGELHVQIHAPVRQADVYLLQPTGPPVDEHLIQLLLMADACRRAGAARVTAVIPYFGYARQDRRTGAGQPVSARLVADCLSVAGVQALMAVDLHSAPIEGFFNMPVAHLTAVPLLAEAASTMIGHESVVIAPDLGAAKLADQYARLLKLPAAVVHKTRLSGSEVVAERVVGDVTGRTPIIVDDMISTGGTVEAAARAVLQAGAIPPVSVVATHGLFVGDAVNRLRGAKVEQILVTDSLSMPDVTAGIESVSLARLLASTIAEMHES